MGAFSWRLPVTNVLVTHWFTDRRSSTHLHRRRNVLKFYFAGGRKTKSFNLDDPKEVNFAFHLAELTSKD